MTKTTFRRETVRGEKGGGQELYTVQGGGRLPSEMIRSPSDGDQVGVWHDMIRWHGKAVRSSLHYHYTTPSLAWRVTCDVWQDSDSSSRIRLHHLRYQFSRWRAVKCPVCSQLCHLASSSSIRPLLASPGLS